MIHDALIGAGAVLAVELVARVVLDTTRRRRIKATFLTEFEHTVLAEDHRPGKFVWSGQLGNPHLVTVRMIPKGGHNACVTTRHHHRNTGSN
jgi:hypothetical protein